jgi:NAD(P)-dependent dehydrogenase (short-subunit alcohol dehydrogenase family)
VPREQLETNVFGILNMSNTFAGILRRNGGGAILNVLSVLSGVNAPVLAAYVVQKAAAWALTNGLRIERAAQGTQVLGLHAGLVDTDMVRSFEAPNSSADDVVRRAWTALEAG